MRFLIFLLLIAGLPGQEDIPKLDQDCSDCHEASGWEDPTFKGFSHSSTSFQLTGSHRLVDCSGCHSGNSVEEKHAFNEADDTCRGCHLDVHQITVV